MEFVIFVNTKLFCQEESYQQDNLYYSQKFIHGAQKKIQDKQFSQFSSLTPTEIKVQENCPYSMIKFDDDQQIDNSQVFENKGKQGYRQNMQQPKPNLLNANNLLHSKFKNLLDQTQNYDLEKEIQKYEFLMILIDQDTFLENKEYCLNIYNYAYKQYWIDKTLEIVEKLQGQQRLFIFILNKLKVIAIEELIQILHGQKNNYFKKLLKQQQQLLDQEKDKLAYNLDLLYKEKQYWQKDLLQLYSKISVHINLKEESFEDIRLKYRFALAHLYKECQNTMDQTQSIDQFIKLKLYLLGCMLLNSIFTTYRKKTFQEFDLDDVSDIEYFIQTQEINQITKLVNHIHKLHFERWK